MPTDPVYNPQLPDFDASMNEQSHSPWQESSPWPESLYSSSGGSSWSALAAGLVAGACLGAAVALLYAPMRGAAMRSSLRDYAGQGAQRLTDLLEDGRSLAEDAVHRAASLIDEGRRAFRTSAGASGATGSPSQPLTASVAEISGYDRRFEEPLGG